ncbi:RHS repeat domain-containing protein [Polyangium fumosum]|nr:RHS repeat-associated core domain-containing protein [Polyangium fumosum]
MSPALLATLPERFLAELREKGITAERDANNGAVVMTDTRGNKTSLLFTETGAPEATVFPSGARVSFEHDARGRLAGVALPSGERIEMGLDENGRLASLGYAGRPVHRFEHDEQGRLTRVAFPDETTTTFDYGTTSLERLTDRTGATTFYTRDEKAGRYAVRDALGRTTTLSAGPQGRLLEVGFADGTTQAYERDADGVLVSVRRRDGSVVQHERDLEGNFTSLRWADGSQTFLRTEEQGTLVIANATSTISIVRDASKRPVREETPIGAVGYEYDDDGRLTCVRTPWGDVVVYGYDADGRLSTVTDWANGITRIEYAPGGGIETIYYGGTLIERRQFARLGLVSSASVYDADGCLVSEQYYSYDTCDRLAGISDRWGPGVGEVDHRRLVLDAEGRLLAEIDAASERVRLEYDYDAKGNIVYDNGSTVHVGCMDEPLSHEGREVIYDPRGNVISLPTPSRREFECRWNEDGTLRETRVGDTRVEYTYDALGRRLSKCVGQSTWRYGWAAGQLLWEEWLSHPDASPIRRDYLYLPDGRPLAFREAGRTYWLQTDPRGAVIRAFDADGNVVWRARYDPFGTAKVEVSRIRQPLRLAGQYEDEETGLYYNLARYYCPWTKTYLSLDPCWLCPGASNYSYARNDPYNRVDPSGAFPWVVVGVLAVGALVGGGISVATEYFFGHGDLWAAFVGGAIEGFFTTAGALIGSVVPGLGTFWGGLIGGAIGTFFGTLVQGWMNGQGWCWECAFKGMVTSIFVDLLTFGLGKIPFVEKLLKKAADQLDDILKRLNIKPPKPDVTEPKPDVTEPKPDVTEPKPDVTEPKPDVTEPKPDVTEPKPDVPEPGAPGSPEHKAARWKEYQERGGEWSYERWSKTYDNNMQRATKAHEVADAYHQQLGWGEREVTVNVKEGVTRRLDIADEATKRGVEIKSGNQYATQDNLWEIERDAMLVKQGWDITWKFDGHASKPLLEELDKAGIPYTIGSP